MNYVLTELKTTWVYKNLGISILCYNTDYQTTKNTISILILSFPCTVNISEKQSYSSRLTKSCRKIADKLNRKTFVIAVSKLGNSVQKNTTSKHWDTVLEYDLVIPDVEKHSEN